MRLGRDQYNFFGKTNMKSPRHPEVGVFATSQAYRRTLQLIDKHRLLTDSLKIPHPPKSFFKYAFTNWTENIHIRSEKNILNEAN